MLRKPQHQTKCYCNNGFGCCDAITNARKPLRVTSSAAAASTSRAGSSQRKNRVPFVKILRQHTCAATKGLGHSHCVNTRQFSRRNSLATTVETTPSKPPTLVDEKLQRYAGYTERRRNYESLKDIALRNDQLILESQVKRDSTKHWQQRQQQQRSEAIDAFRHDEEEFRLIVDLQKFRLNNPLDCFSDDHLYALRLQQQLEGLDRSSNWATPVNQSRHTFTITVRPCEATTRNGEHAASVRPAADDAEHPAPASRQLTPYAVRQKLLQLRLLEEAESEVSLSQRLRRRQQIAPVQKSCALSYQAR